MEIFRVPFACNEETAVFVTDTPAARDALQAFLNGVIQASDFITVMAGINPQFEEVARAIVTNCFS